MALLFDFQYHARIINASGGVDYFYNDFTSIYYKSIVNSPGLAIVTVPDDHPILDILTDDLLMEVMFGYPSPFTSGKTYFFAKDFSGLYRDQQIATDEYGNLYHLLYFVGTNDILSRYICAYPAGTLLKSQFNSHLVEGIMDLVFTYNCTSSATVANGRYRTITPVRSAQIAITGDLPGATATASYSCAYKNVLDIMRELAVLGNIDFKVDREIGGVGPAGALKFGTWNGQLGTDRSSSLIFALELQNINQVSLNGDRLREKTVVIVGGSGEGSNREIGIRTGSNYSTTNEYELFADARGSGSGELSAIGDARLAETEAKTTVDAGDVLQTSGYYYKRDYGLGDKVGVLFAGEISVKKLNVVEVKFEEKGSSNIRIGFDNA